MTYYEYQERGGAALFEYEREAETEGGYKRCKTCGREFYDEGRGQSFCSRRCKDTFYRWVVTQRKIDGGNAPKGYCPYMEHCEDCPEKDCICEKFAFAVPYAY